MPSKYFHKIAEKVTPDIEYFTTNSLDIIDQVHFLLEQKGMTQKDLAEKMGKTESEISKLLSPAYSMTLLTISKIEAALGSDIIKTPLRFAQEQEKDFDTPVPEEQEAKIVSFKADILDTQENNLEEQSPYDSEASASKVSKKPRLNVA